MRALPLPIRGKSRMRKRACTDLCGGRSAMVVPTATVMQIVMCGSVPTSRLVVSNASGHHKRLAIPILEPQLTCKELDGVGQNYEAALGSLRASPATAKVS
jgi:hypothetical protein